jgi:hypothetical protein
MPLSQKQLDEDGVPISFEPKGEVRVRVGPCSAKSLNTPTIPLDGRRYICAGEILFKGGRRVRAHFEIQTHTFDFLDPESVHCTLGGDLWYHISEPELATALAMSQSDMKPFEWIPDRPLADTEPGPYPMKWSPKK